jgi:Zn-dependent protease
MSELESARPQAPLGLTPRAAVVGHGWGAPIPQMGPLAVVIERWRSYPKSMGTTTRVPRYDGGTEPTAWQGPAWPGPGGWSNRSGASTSWTPPGQPGDAGGPPGSRDSRRSDDWARHSIPLGRVAGIRLQVHWSFLVLLAFVVLVEWGAGPGAVLAGLAWIGVLFACVVLHEIAHCVVARRRGGGVLGILLLPIGGMSRMDRLPSAPADEAAIAVAGPATSVAIGALSLAVGAAIGSSMWPPTLFAGSPWARLGWLNLLLGAFNLLPALPMDGGRVLRAVLARHRTKLEATRIASTVARVLAVAMVAVGFFWDFWLILIGVFVYLGAAGEEAQAEDEKRRRNGGRGGGPRNGPPTWGSSTGDWGPPLSASGPAPGPETGPDSQIAPAGAPRGGRCSAARRHRMPPGGAERRG